MMARRSVFNQSWSMALPKLHERSCDDDLMLTGPFRAGCYPVPAAYVSKANESALE